MDINTCRICEQEVKEDSHYFKFHKIKQKDYFERFYENFDLLTGEQIEFKSKESFFNTDFINKNNLKKYLELKSKEEGLKYCENWLKRRKEYKSLEYQLSEFECKSLCFPSISYIEKTFGIGSYNRICHNVELKLKYNYDRKLELQNKELEIICDTREQNLLKFSNIQIEKLDYGDYTIEDNKGIYIERKSLIDAIGTLSQGYDRFIKEIERCKNDKNYLIVVIEEKYNNLLSFSYLPHMKRIQASEAFILHRIRELLQKYPLNLQFLCVDGRKESVRIIENIFKISENIRNIDLQWTYNEKLL